MKNLYKPIILLLCLYILCRPSNVAEDQADEYRKTKIKYVQPQYDTIPHRYDWDSGILEYQIQRIEEQEHLRILYDENHPAHQPSLQKEKEDGYDGYFND